MDEESRNELLAMKRAEWKARTRAEYHEPPQEPSNWHPVTITKVANGFCLQIGCKIFIARAWEEAYRGLADYWDDPWKAEQKYSLPNET